MTISKISLDKDSTLFLVGFRIDSERIEPQFYILYVDSERPIDLNGYPIIFFDRNNASKALKESNCGCEHLPFHSLDEYTYIDIAQAIYEIGICSKTENANILNSLNMILDFVAFLPQDRQHRNSLEIINRAADYFTLSKDINEFFELTKISRIELVQSIEWVIGAIVLYAKFIY
jgi:hypothetical protein